MKKSVWVLVAIGLIALLVFIYVAMHRESIIDMNNKTCPVSGRPVDGVHSCVHKGKRYNMCTDKCGEAMHQNPEKYQ